MYLICDLQTLSFIQVHYLFVALLFAWLFLTAFVVILIIIHQKFPILDLFAILI